MERYLAWKYKRELLISNPSATEDLQVSFTLLYYPGMRYDFRDIRFTTVNGAAIPYFIESATNFSSAFIWLKLPANTSIILLYYGNGTIASASDAASVFDLWDDFLGTSLNTSVWTVGGSGGTVSASILTLQHSSLSGYIESKTLYAPNSLVEMRIAHQSGQRGPFGFRSTSTQKAAAWQGAAGSLLTDHRFAHNGSSGDWDNDGVNRSGSAYNVYGVAHIAAGPRYYVNYSYRGEITTTIPGAVNLPVQIYSYYGEGYIKADWVRVRKYSASVPTISVGRKYINQQKTFTSPEPIIASTQVSMTTDVSLKGFVNASTRVSMVPVAMFRQPLFYQPAVTGPYKQWKFKGDVRIETLDRPVQIDIPLSPRMAVDGRDLRFSDLQGNILKYNIESVENGMFSCWVDAPEDITKIHYYYGNGAAVSESDDSITGEPSLLTEYYLPEIPGPYIQWKFRGDIEITDTPAGETVQRVNIDLLPGMILDGRDLRFSSPSGQEISYRIESLESGVFTCLVEWPAGASKLYFHYGNGTAVSESDDDITLDPVVTTMSMPSSVAYPRWKYRGDIRISTAPAVDTQILVDIPRLPGMTLDGRDLRFSDGIGTVVKYFLEASDSDLFSVWVKWPAGSPRVNFYYGNGTAVSESSAADVFNFWEDFDTLDSGVWTTLAGSPVISDSKLYLSSASVNSFIRSVASFGTGTICEMRMYHAQNNQMICGYFATGNLRVCWLGASGVSDNDYMHTYNGSTSTTTNDNVARYGTTFYKYGVAYNSGSAVFYVDDALRGTITTNVPSGDLPIGLYSEVNAGDLVVDWIRVRQQTDAVATVERHYPQSVSGFQIEVVQPTIAFVSRHYSRWQVPFKIDTPVTAAVLERHYPRWQTAIRYYDYIASQSYVFMHPSLAKWRERKELKDYSVGAIEVSKSINDTYLQLSTEFVDLVVPPEESTIKHHAYDSQGNPQLIFSGKVVANSHVLRHNGSTASMQAADLSRNLVVQKIPWNYQVVDGESASWPSWISVLLAPEETGVYAKTLIDTAKEAKQFVFNPKTTRLEAIKEIAAYADCMIHTKLISREIDGITVTRPEFYLVPPENIDLSANGFDLPAPITLIYPDLSLVDEPKIVSEPEEKYNKVTVHGILSETGETVVASAFSAEVYSGEQKAREYLIEDNSISEKGSTAEREAVKWLLYFLSPRAKVSMQFVDRFDLELYQRIRFGSGFHRNLQTLTSSVQVPLVYACDPKDAANSTHSVDVAGVPRPSWLRISEIKYHSEHALETVDVTAITDFIYSSVDPVVPEPYSQFLSPGYMKPIIDDLIQTTQTIVDDSIEKQLTPESCTVLSINEDGKTAVVQTASGKIVTVSLA